MSESPKKNFVPNKGATKTWGVWAALALVVLALSYFTDTGSQTLVFGPKEFQAAIDGNTLTKIEMRAEPALGKNWYLVTGKVQNPAFGMEDDTDKKVPRDLNFKFEGSISDKLHETLTQSNGRWDIKEVPASAWKNMLIGIIPFLLLAILIFWFITRLSRSVGKSQMDFGKSRARLLSPDKDRVTFADVAGCEESKEEVAEIVDFLRTPERFNEIGAKIPKGILMVGPPGTGKTLIARAIAGEANVPFYTISGSDFVEMFVGVGAARVRDMFEQARKTAPCLIFIDEIDAVGRQRGAGLGGGNDEREQTLNSLLVEMDGFDGHEGIIVIAATNRPDVLDQALLRPGRFDRQVVIDLPDVKGREDILKIHAAKIKLADDVDFEKIAKLMPGASGADLANLLNEGAITAARRKSPTVSANDIDVARDKILLGRERKQIMTGEEKKVIAYHEAGHALIQTQVDDGVTPVHKVTIIPHGRALGLTMSLPNRDIHLNTKEDLLNRICMALGGRVAEETVFGKITNGASGDIAEVTKIARKMVCDWGMSKAGLVSLGSNQEHIFLGREIARETHYSERTAQLIDDEVKNIIDEQHARAIKIMTEKRAELDLIAEALIALETIDGETVYAIMNGEVKNVDELVKAKSAKAAEVQQAQNTETEKAEAPATQPVFTEGDATA